MNIKKSIRDIVEYPYKEKSYLIYDNDGDFFVIYERRWKKVIGGDLYNVFMTFLKGNIEWNYPRKTIVRDLDRNLKEWQYLDDDAKDKIVDIEVLFINGEKQELNK